VEGITGFFIRNRWKNSPKGLASWPFNDLENKTIPKSVEPVGGGKSRTVPKRKNSPSKPYNFNKLSDKEKEEKFLNIYDENIQNNKKMEKLERELKM
jgi:hypothetical protein